MTTNKKRDAKILEIAKEQLFLQTIESLHSDSLDFQKQAAWRIKTALELAYQAGRESK